MLAAPNPPVTVIIPCRNERAHLSAFLASLAAQQAKGLDVEFLVADGMSDDGTREALREFSKAHPNFRLIDNPERFVSTGLNRAIRAARGDIIVRMDVHTEYAPDYIAQCVCALEMTDADNVGGAARTRAHGYLQSAICLAYHSSFSTGGARFHQPDYLGEVDTVTYGCWRKSTLLRLGLFDEELVRNQDDELNLRIIRSGGRIWQTPLIKSWYHPRASLRALFSQYAQYGYWKVRVIQKHKLPASWRHLVPGALVGGIAGLGVAACFSKLFLVLWLAWVAAYLLGNLAGSALTCRRREDWRFLPVMPLILATYHFSYGYGFLRGLIDFGLLRKGGGKSFTALTRTVGEVK